MDDFDDIVCMPLAKPEKKAKKHDKREADVNREKHDKKDRKTGTNHKDAKGMDKGDKLVVKGEGKTHNDTKSMCTNPKKRNTDTDDKVAVKGVKGTDANDTGKGDKLVVKGKKGTTHTDAKSTGTNPKKRKGTDKCDKVAAKGVTGTNKSDKLVVKGDKGTKHTDGTSTGTNTKKRKGTDTGDKVAAKGVKGTKAAETDMGAEAKKHRSTYKGEKPAVKGTKGTTVVAAEMAAKSVKDKIGKGVENNDTTACGIQKPSGNESEHVDFKDIMGTGFWNDDLKKASDMPHGLRLGVDCAGLMPEPLALKALGIPHQISWASEQDCFEHPQHFRT
jgi:hypothetical protein